MNKERIVKFMALFLVLMSVFCLSNFGASAADSSETPGNKDQTGITEIICNVIRQVTGGIGKAISILILISMAIGLFLGKITWGLAIAVMVGMGLLFGAPTLVDVIAGSQGGGNNVCAIQNSGKQQ